MNINYEKLAIFAASRHISYNELCAVVRDSLIAQANAAPEQEPVVLPAERTRRTTDIRDEAFDNGFNECLEELIKLGPLYTHADPSEVAQLRAELERMRERVTPTHKSLISKHAEIIAERDAATQRADAAERIAQHNANCVGELERKLASVTEYVQGMVNAAGSQPSVATGYLRDILEALLSASAEPANQVCEHCHGLGTAFTDYCEKCEPAKGGDGEVQS